MRNKRRILLSCLITIAVVNGYAQNKYARNRYDSYENEVEVENIKKVTFFNPGFSLENKIGKLQTLYGQAFMNTGASSRRGAYGVETKFYFDPALTLQYRYYYNARNRHNKGLRTERNNLNYISPMIETIFSKMPVSIYNEPVDKRRAINRIGAVGDCRETTTDILV